MDIVLDTHILVWWVDGNDKLSTKAVKVINKAQQEKSRILLSSITAWEICMLINKGRLSLRIDIRKWLETVQMIDCVEFVPVTNEIAMTSTSLPNFDYHKDPADRMIIATASIYGATLITADETIRSYEHVRTLF
ncbi:type II toxin-antitoxin system VapC family toxin [Cysteiniphilum sp. 6C5]|uniref:type II toxin-antitoxin system VapC family toxin n=1 Tax=unclassified Cysteiniphilum TaxID=2610889 RepID=UPI003F852C16